MALDKNCTDVPYLLGRMYAIIEHSVNGSYGHFPPKFFRDAFQTPYVIFPQIHATYLGDSPRVMEEELFAIANELPSEGFPKRLTVQEQSQFCLAYDQQLAEIHRSENRRMIAKAIKLKRTELDLTQAQLADKASVTKQTILNIESCNCNVSIDVLSAVMTTLGIKMALD